VSLVEQALSAHEALLAFTERQVGFVTGQLVRVDLVAQTARVLNAGHPHPFRLRQGRVEEIELTAQEPFGAVEGASWSEQKVPLEAGDRLLFLTDGMLERNAESLDIPALMLASAHLHPREAIQYLTQFGARRRRLEAAGRRHLAVLRLARRRAGQAHSARRRGTPDTTRTPLIPSPLEGGIGPLG
jgi:hypothetical protein